MIELSDELVEMGVDEAKLVKKDLDRLGDTDVTNVAYIYERRGVESNDSRQQIRYFSRGYLAHAIFAMANMDSQAGESPEEYQKRLESCSQIVDSAGYRLPLEVSAKLSVLAHRLQFSGGAPEEL